MDLRYPSTRPLVALLAALALTLPATAAAHQCSFGIDAELEITPERVVIDDDDLGEVVIGADGELEIDGRDVALDAEQQEAVEAYADQLREVVPAVIDVAIEGVEIGIVAVTEVFAALTGGETPASVDESLKDLRADIDARLGRRDGTWYVREDGISDLDETLDSMEPLIEEAVAESVGALLMAVGQAIASGEGSLDGRMEAFSERMERMDEDIEARVEKRAEAIEARAAAPPLAGRVPRSRGASRSGSRDRRFRRSSEPDAPPGSRTTLE